MSTISHFIPSHQAYSWGKKGESSYVFQLLKSSTSKPLNTDTNYAELWMGDHPTCPCYLKDGSRLSTFGDISFLMKILSIATPLSLQVHPGAEDADHLHSIDPITYCTPSPKPEMGIFITPVTLIYGIRPYKEIIYFLNEIEPFSAVCSVKAKERFLLNPTPETLKSLVRSILYCQKTELIQAISVLITLDFDVNTKHAINLIHQYFPEDPGCFFPLISNIVSGGPGSAIYIPTGTLHSYLEGDLFEIMTLSDNVVRAAMTPKKIDIDTLLMITNFSPLEPCWITPEKASDNHLIFKPNQLYSVDFITLEPGQEYSTSFPRISILLSIDGSISINGNKYTHGTPIVVKAETRLQIVSEEKCSIFVGY